MKIDGTQVESQEIDPKNCPELKEKLQQSNEILKRCFDDFRLDEVFLSFNGGKDCTVLLDLIVRLLNGVNCPGYESSQLQCWYMEPEDEAFEEIEQFVISCQTLYNIKINRIRGKIKDVLGIICKENPKIKACIMGSRRTDPYCGTMKAFQRTDAGWPDLIRVNPLLDWTYDNIWDYIRGNKVNYCSLYDLGYTSLGHKHNTIPNPHLKCRNSATNVGYYPAYCLRNRDQLERAGRNVAKTTGT